jgi:hypothetical protein
LTGAAFLATGFGALRFVAGFAAVLAAGADDFAAEADGLAAALLAVGFALVVAAGFAVDLDWADFLVADLLLAVVMR